MKGDTNRQIAADNRLLKEIKARITRLYNWSKEQAAQPQGRERVMSRLMEARLSADKPTSRNGRLQTLKENATLLNFLTSNDIQSMQQLYEKVSAMNRDYYDLRCQIVSGERRLRVLDERVGMWVQYEKYKPVYRQLEKLKPKKRNLFREKHSADLALFHAAARYLENLESIGEAITPKIWQAEVENLTAQHAHTYGRYQNVFLSDAELAELQAELPALWRAYIDRLSEYIASTGKQYQNHAATIRRWAAEDSRKTAPPTRNRDYIVREDETV